MSTPANPPAFARPTSKGQSFCDDESQEGMSLRDYFAAKVMQSIGGMIIDGKYDKTIEQKTQPLNRAAWIAEQAYFMADAMLAERAKTL